MEASFTPNLNALMDVLLHDLASKRTRGDNFKSAPAPTAGPLMTRSLLWPPMYSRVLSSLRVGPVQVDRESLSEANWRFWNSLSPIDRTRTLITRCMLRPDDRITSSALQSLTGIGGSSVQRWERGRKRGGQKLPLLKDERGRKTYLQRDLIGFLDEHLRSLEGLE